ncbi:class I SAM-dependent methyltransferase [Candidatus Aalborgicola defluviihabitans]|nr:class I SAM-dependent methyltransferase [Burkholderiales bacterium]
MFFGISNQTEFVKGIQQCVNNIQGQQGIYSGDNLFTYHRNLSFLEDAPLMQAVQKHAQTDVERAILWRFSTVVWGARNGLKLDGDFVECACYKGTTARIICDAINFAGQKDRRYYLYDLFDHDPSMAHHAMPEHSKLLYQSVKDRFADAPNVVVTQGSVPAVLSDVAPEKIAFMHLDLNNADAEVGALDVLFERMVPGAVLVLDDYGWLGYRAQKLAEDPWFAARGYFVVELPTGQGLVIKQKD